jgi:hypothetical protein
LTLESDLETTYELVFDSFDNFCPSISISYSFDKDLSLENLSINSEGKLSTQVPLASVSSYNFTIIATDDHGNQAESPQIIVNVGEIFA